MSDNDDDYVHNDLVKRMSDTSNDDHVYIDLLEKEPAKVADETPNVKNVVKVDVSEIVSALREFNKIIQSKRFGCDAMTGWNAGLCISCTFGSIAISAFCFVGWYLQNYKSNGNIGSCNCKCD